MKKQLVLFTLLLLLSLMMVGCTKDVEDENLTVEVNGTSVDGTFTGTLDGGKAEGEGSFKCAISDTENWVYEGDFTEGNLGDSGQLSNYPMTIEFDGNEIEGIYNGAVEKGAVSGEGTFTSNSEDYNFEYDGEWKDGTISGSGNLTYDKYVVHFSEVDRTGSYSGETLDGIASGEGTFTATNDESETYTYTGEWKDGLWNGQGSQVYEDNNYYKKIGTFKDGDFDPTLLEWVTALGTSDNMSYVVNDNVSSFLSKHENLFPCEKEKNVEKYVDEDLSYKMIHKNSSKYGDKLVKLSNYEVLQIQEFDDVLGRIATEIRVVDADYEDNYVIYYPGSLNELYEGDKATIYGLPISSCYYETTIGGTDECVLLLGAYIKY